VIAIHPAVLKLMELHCETPEQLEVLVRHHLGVTPEQLAEAEEADELDAYRDAVGWD